MNSVFTKTLVVLFVFLGEAFSIYAEMLAARNNYFSSQPIFQTFLKGFLIITIGGGLLILGYMLGFKSFKNIWIVSVTSITSILIIEPILAYTFFHQLPTKGALIGLIFGTLGFLATIFL